MKIKISKLLLLSILIFQYAVTTAQKKNKNRETTQIVLFDGTSTDAWKDHKSENFPEHGWQIKGEILTVLGKTDTQEGGHDIITKEQFSNFVLELEVLLSEGANSGIKYMVVNTYPGKEGNYLGLEYQLIDNEKHPDALLGRNGNRKMATLYDILPARDNIKVNPAGSWNKVKIVVGKNRVEHWINDKIVIAYNRKSDSYKELVRFSKYKTLENFGSQKKGHILLQGHGNEVSFKNIKITVLKK